MLELSGDFFQFGIQWQHFSVVLGSSNNLHHLVIEESHVQENFVWLSVWAQLSDPESLLPHCDQQLKQKSLKSP